MNNTETKAMLDALLEQQIPSTTWSIDPLGDVWMINIVTGEAKVIMHLCEMSDTQQAQFTRQLIDSINENKRICRMTSGRA